MQMKTNIYKNILVGTAQVKCVSDSFALSSCNIFRLTGGTVTVGVILRPQNL